MWIHQELSQGSSRIKHLDEAGSIRIHHMYLHLDRPLESTKIQNWHLPGFIAGIHLDPPMGSTRIHNVYYPGSTRIYQDPPGSYTGIQQDQRGSLNSPRSGGKLFSEKFPRFQEFPQIWGKMALNFCVFLIFFCYQNLNTKNLCIYIIYIQKQNFTSKYSFLSLKLLYQING